jgi:hypothetical protein
MECQGETEGLKGQQTISDATWQKEICRMISKVVPYILVAKSGLYALFQSRESENPVLSSLGPGCRL